MSKKCVLKEDIKVYINGVSQVLLKGGSYPCNSKIVKENKKSFIVEEIEKEIKVEKEESKVLELLVETPIKEAEVIVESVESVKDTEDTENTGTKVTKQTKRRGRKPNQTKQAKQKK